MAPVMCPTSTGGGPSAASAPAERPRAPTATASAAAPRSNARMPPTKPLSTFGEASSGPANRVRSPHHGGPANRPAGLFRGPQPHRHTAAIDVPVRDPVRPILLAEQPHDPLEIGPRLE